MKIFSYSFFLLCIICKRNEKEPSMESAVSFAPLRPAGFVNFTGRGGLACFSAGWGEHPWRWPDLTFDILTIKHPLVSVDISSSEGHFWAKNRKSVVVKFFWWLPGEINIIKMHYGFNTQDYFHAQLKHGAPSEPPDIYYHIVSLSLWNETQISKLVSSSIFTNANLRMKSARVMRTRGEGGRKKGKKRAKTSPPSRFVQIEKNDLLSETSYRYFHIDIFYGLLPPLLSIKLAHDVHMVFTWCSHDVHMMFTWCSHDVHMMFTWCSHDVHMMFTWCADSDFRDEESSSGAGIAYSRS